MAEGFQQGKKRREGKREREREKKKKENSLWSIVKSFRGGVRKYPL